MKVNSPGTVIENNFALVSTWFSELSLDMNWMQGPIPHDITVRNNEVTLANPAAFSAPAVIYADQRGLTTATGITRAAPMLVRDIYNLVFSNNTFPNILSQITPVKTRNAVLTPGQRF